MAGSLELHEDWRREVGHLSGGAGCLCSFKLGFVVFSLAHFLPVYISACLAACWASLHGQSSLLPVHALIIQCEADSFSLCNLASAVCPHLWPSICMQVHAMCMPFTKMARQVCDLPCLQRSKLM